MVFVENEVYVDREGNEYKYLYKTGGVTVFESADGKRFVQHFSGRYRWDDQDHPRDIIGKK
jgi:hypothetical protein